MRKENPDWWKIYPLTFGKYKGETIYNIMINDYSYIKWLDSVQLDKTTRAAINEAIKYYSIHFTH
jgi:hypothetical protein